MLQMQYMIFFSPLSRTTTSTYPVRLGDLSTRLFRDFRVKWDKGFGAGGRKMQWSGSE